MKKGFTMIELIFVIVILGILAAVAVPRLTATRDDAELAKAATNLTTAISDITAYYTSQGELSSKIGDMTNVILDGKDTKVGTLKVKNEACLTLTVGKKADAGKDDKSTDSTLIIAKSAVAESASAKKICTSLYELPAIKKILETDGGVIELAGKGIKWGDEATPPANQ